MANKAFKKTYTENQELNNLQENIEEVIQPLVKNPLLDGLVLTDVVLTTGQDNRVDHKLGRKLLGWTVVGLNANAVIYDNQANNSLPNSTLLLRTSANCTVKLYVF